MDKALSVLFVCVKNGGKSQMAAGLMRHAVGGAVSVDSAGTEPGTKVNALSVQALREIGIDIADQIPKALTSELIAAADLIVVLGLEARVQLGEGPPVEVWDTDEPADRGLEGIERMRLVRQDIAFRVCDLALRLHSARNGKTAASAIPR